MNRNNRTPVPGALAAVVLLLSACTLPLESPGEERTGSWEPYLPEEGSGAVSASMLIPDYHLLAAGGASRAIPPQAVTVRLSLLGDGDFTVHQSLSLRSGGMLTPVEGAAAGFPGSIWRGTFSGIPARGYYEGSLKIDLLDAQRRVITSGLNGSLVEIGGSRPAAAEFFTLPVVTDSREGSLEPGEMKFWSVQLAPGRDYTVTLTVNAWDPMPDLVLFDSSGRFSRYFSETAAPEASVSLSADSEGVYYLGVWADAGAVSHYRLELPPPDQTFVEGFETGDLSAHPWLLEETTSQDVLPTVVSTSPADGSRCLEFPSRNMFTGETSSASLPVTAGPASAVRFMIRTDIGTDVSTSLVFYLDNIRIDAWNGLGGTWTTYSFPLSEGDHTLRWTLEKNSNAYYEGAANAAWIDDVGLVPDTTSFVSVSPGGPVESYIGMEPIRFQAFAHRADGSVRQGATFSWSVSPVSGGNGTITPDGAFTATAGGTCIVRAVGTDGIGGQSRLVTVLPSDYLNLPYVYNGTRYEGMAPGGTGEPGTGTSATVAVTLPAAAEFSADGFFTLEGSVAQPEAYDYALVEVIHDASDRRTMYLVRNNFRTRIWLRFGPGRYTVNVCEFVSITLNLDGEGDMIAASWNSPAYSFSVTNTRDEDGTFLYPSDAIQSDDLRIANLARHLTDGLSGDRARVRAIHDWVVQYLYYDRDSLVAGRRKKQDALTVLAGGTAVCEGYTSIANALLRFLGLRAKAVYGRTSGGAHAWTNVLLDGSYLFLDTTWDDPSPRQGDAGISYRYYLLSSLTGVNGDHTPQDDRASRALTSGLPTWRGYPDGWY